MDIIASIALMFVVSAPKASPLLGVAVLFFLVLLENSFFLWGWWFTFSGYSRGETAVALLGFFVFWNLGAELGFQCARASLSGVV